jgi:hypothetical protein
LALADQAVSEDEEESKNGEAEENKSEDSYRPNIMENPELVEMQEEEARSLVVSSATFVP